MNFRQQLSEAYKAGFNQGLEDLQEKQSPAGGGSVPKGTKPKKRPQRGGDPLGGRKPISAGYHEGMKRGLMAGYHEAMKEMDHEKDEGYHEGAHEMDEKALAELGRMMIRAGMHEMDHEEDEGYHEGMHEGEHDEIEELAHDVGLKDPFLGISELDNYKQILANRKAFADILKAFPPVRRGG